MGTRADFYIGRGESAEWLGSIAWDGYPTAMPKALRKAKTADEFRAAVAKLSERDDFTRPEDGWPWAWDDSTITDYAYAFDDGMCLNTLEDGWVSTQAHRKYSKAYEAWERANTDESPPELTEIPGSKQVFPNMSARKSVTFGKRSGILLFG